MKYVNVSPYSKCPTKKYLKENLATIQFKTTSLFDQYQIYSVENIPENTALSVVGPTEYERKWYANVSKVNGQIKVS